MFDMERNTIVEHAPPFPHKRSPGQRRALLRAHSLHDDKPSDSEGV